MLVPILQADTGIDPVLPLDQFSKIVILENGRIKPLHTFAQNVLKQFSGRSRYGKTPAIQWLAKLLFDPEASHQDKVFLVNNPQVLHAVGIEVTGKERDRYSFLQLQDSLNRLRELAMKASRIEQEKRDIVENELIILYNKLYYYRQLTAGMLFAIPHQSFSIRSPELKAQLNFPANQNEFSLLDIQSKSGLLVGITEQAKTRSTNGYQESDTEAFRLQKELQNWLRRYQGLPLTIIPPGNQTQGNWVSPWEKLLVSFIHRQEIDTEIIHLNHMVKSYRLANADTFQENVAQFNRLSQGMPGAGIEPGKISLEISYNKIDPFYKSAFFYGFSTLFLLLSYLFFKKWFYYLSFILFILGMMPHTFGLVARVLISGRPPVTNLYETFVFTGWITAVCGLVLELMKKKNIGIFTGSISGLAMMIIAGRYALEGDTLGMLVAVLDSNFWLATHVITITIGYAGIVMSGVIGHLYIFQRVFFHRKDELLKNTFQAVYATQAFGLIFTFVGTVLGGIWADQSWGRFWGWDPKENGALLIILWSVILFHAKMARWLKPLGFSLGSVIGIITVILAWFGVNLLGVGLHSYGFTSGVANSLFIYSILEILFMAISYVYITQREKTAGLSK